MGEGLLHYQIVKPMKSSVHTDLSLAEQNSNNMFCLSLLTNGDKIICSIFENTTYRYKKTSNYSWRCGHSKGWQSEERLLEVGSYCLVMMAISKLQWLKWVLIQTTRKWYSVEASNILPKKFKSSGLEFDQEEEVSKNPVNPEVTRERPQHQAAIQGELLHRLRNTLI